MTDRDQAPVGRIAFRHEGLLLVAYFAQPDTMEDAHFLASISLAVASVPHLRERFQGLMRDMVSHIITKSGGPEIEWGESVAAPTHERAGHA